MSNSRDPGADAPETVHAHDPSSTPTEAEPRTDVDTLFEEPAPATDANDLRASAPTTPDHPPGEPVEPDQAPDPEPSAPPEQPIPADEPVARSRRASREEEPTDDLMAIPLPESFDGFALNDALREAITANGWTKPTRVQVVAFEPISKGRDVLVQSQTGTGKTGAFCLPWLASRFEAGDAAETGVQMITLVPTRELAKQVCDELVRLAHNTRVVPLPVYGGTAMQPQLNALRTGVHAVVGTPGRVLDHIRRRSLDLSRVRMVVLDEADEMLSMGFLEDIHAILDACPKDRQTTLFSATVPSEVERIARRYMRQPLSLKLSGDAIAAAEIHHAYYSCTSAVKTRDLLDVIAAEEPTIGLVFCNTREEVNMVSSVLQREGFAAEPLSSDLTQSARERVIGWMREGRLRFLVATDVASRGIDISHISHVINYSFPENAESYVHRTGRTGRAGRPGQAISLISPHELGNFYYLKLQYPTIAFSERHLPPAEDLQATRTELKLDHVSSLFPELVSPEWTLLARNLMKDPRGERVIAFLLNEAMSKQPRRTSLLESEGAGGEAGSLGEGDRAGFRDRNRGRSDRGGPPGAGREQGRFGRDRGGQGGQGEHRGRDEHRGQGDARGYGDRGEQRGRDGERAPRAVEGNVEATPAIERSADEQQARGPRGDRDRGRGRGDRDRGRGRDDRPRGDRPQQDRPQEDRPRGEPSRAPAEAGVHARGSADSGEQSPAADSGVHAFDPAEGGLSEARDVAGWDAPSHDDASLEPREASGEAHEGEAIAGEGEAQGRRRRRRRRRGGRDGAEAGGDETREPASTEGARTVGDGREPASMSAGEGAGIGESDEGDDDAPTAGADGAAGDNSTVDAGASAEGQSRRRRRRRRRRGGERTAADGTQPQQNAAQAGPSAERDDEGEGEGEGEEGDDEDGAEESGEGGSDAAGSGDAAGRGRRRRRRRGRRRGNEGAPSVSTAAVVTPEPTVMQDEIVVDIDESELQIVRDQFGEIDELDDFTLKARRRGVLDTLAEEVELEDLTLRDRREPTPSAPAANGDASGTDDDEDDDAEGEADGERETDGEGEGEAAAGTDDDANPRKRRRRRRKKKKPDAEPPQPALMVPPHKDFWEVWASHFSYRDFEDTEPPEPEPEPVVHHQQQAFERSAPVPEGDWVTVRLSIGRAHARKAADVRDLLADRTGLSGKAVRNLTVREQDTELQIAASAWPKLERAFSGAAVEGVSITAELLSSPDDDDDANDDADATDATDATGDGDARSDGDGVAHEAAESGEHADVATEDVAEAEPGDAIEPAPAT